MRTIRDIKKEYFGKIDALDLDLLIAHILKKPREFVLAHPELVLTEKQARKIEELVKRRLSNEPLAYILGSREFLGYPFLVSPATLIPRPETEMMVEEALGIIGSYNRKIGSTIIDVGTGSGNIIISLAKSLNSFCHSRAGKDGIIFFAVDISSAALRVARRNAKKNNVEKKIKFIHGDILEPFIRNLKLEIRNYNFIILANLPYLSQKVYAATKPNVKKFEPRSALYSQKDGLAHYEKLFKQMIVLKAKNYRLKAILEFSPEQKVSLAKMIKKYFPTSKSTFKKDLAGKWRMAVISA